MMTEGTISLILAAMIALSALRAAISGMPGARDTQTVAVRRGAGRMGNRP